MTIEEAVAKDLVAILFVTFLFGGGVLWLIVATVAENVRKARASSRQAELKQAMIEKGFRADEIARVLNSGGGADELKS
jgi:heme/copper-type cytochrome/quinol oxidase subunit 2